MVGSIFWRTMQRRIATILVCLLAFLTAMGAQAPAQAEPSVLVAILARNKAHTLPHYLECLENFDYDKKSIAIYINTNNNDDETAQILQAWADKHKNAYRQIVFEEHQFDGLMETRPHWWSFQRLKLLGAIRNKSLQMAKTCGCDYYFVADCDNFIRPETLKCLVSKNLPIVAPFLKPIPAGQDHYTNFWTKSTSEGYYIPDPDPKFADIRDRRQLGTFKVDVVHNAYLIQTRYVDKLTYDDESNRHEFVIFCDSARKNGVDQYICNERDFGTMLHIHDDPKRTSQQLIELEKKVVADLTTAQKAPTTSG